MTDKGGNFRHTCPMDSLPSNNIPGNAPFLNDKQWAVILHLSGLLGLAIPGVGNWAAPLLIWLLKRSESTTIDSVGKEVLNFQISYTIYSAVLGLITAILVWILIGFLLIPLLFILAVVWLVLMIVAAVKASNGEFYRYPATIRFLS